MKIAVLPGDGIGPEIVKQAVRVLEVLRSDGLKIELEYAHIGGAGYDAAKDPLPEATLKLAQASDAVLLGAVGGYQYDTLPRPQRPEQGLLRIRKALGLFANLRPAMVYPELANASSLKSEVVAGLDIMILRELTGALPPFCEVVKNTGSIRSKSCSSRIRCIRTEPTIPRQPTRPTLISPPFINHTRANSNPPSYYLLKCCNNRIAHRVRAHFSLAFFKYITGTQTFLQRFTNGHLNTQCNILTRKGIAHHHCN